MPQHNSLLTFYRENAKAAITAILPDIIEQVAKMADDVESPSAGLWGRGFYAAAREIASAQRDLAQVDSGAG